MPSSLRKARLGKHYFEEGNFRSTGGPLPVARFAKPKPLLDLISPHIDEGKASGEKEGKVTDPPRLQLTSVQEMQVDQITLLRLSL